MATFDAHKNFAYSTIATAPSPASSGTSLVVASGDGTKFPAASFNAVVWPAGVQPSSSNAEIVRVTAKSTDTFTITRAQEGSSARSIVVGDQIAAAPTAKWWSDVEGLFPTGSVLGTTDTQTVTNKDISSVTNTFPAKFVFLQLVGTTSDTGVDVTFTNTSYGAYYLGHYPLVQKPTGFKVYARLITTLKISTGVQTAYARIYANGGTVGEVSTSNTSFVTLDSGWVDVSSNFTNEGASQFFASQYRVSGGTGTHQNTCLVLAFGP